MKVVAFLACTSHARMLHDEYMDMGMDTEGAYGRCMDGVNGRFMERPSNR